MAAEQVILVAGSTGAGKTTYARNLADAVGGIVLSIDDWMTTLFWMDSPQPIAFDWTMERISRCETTMWAVALAVAGRGLPVILDLGFTRRDHRQAFRDRGEAAGLRVAVHGIDGDAETRWARVQQRNRDRGATYVMQVDRAMFDFMEEMWEPPTAEECEANGGRMMGLQHDHA